MPRVNVNEQTEEWKHAHHMYGEWLDGEDNGSDIEDLMVSYSKQQKIELLEKLLDDEDAGSIWDRMYFEISELKGE